MIQNLMNLGKGEKMTKGEVIKMAVGTFIGFGVDMAVSSLLGQYIPAGGGFRRWMKMLGALALGFKLGEDVENWFYKAYDETKDAFAEAKKEIAEAEAEEGAAV